METKRANEDITQPNPAMDIIKMSYLQKAVKNDLGGEAELKSFEIKDFTATGDNYMCYVTSVLCKVEISGEEDSVSYVAKVNPKRPMGSMKEAMHQQFVREGLFLLEVLPKISETLRSYGHPPVNYPKCFFGTWEDQDEILILQDMRTSGFSMTQESSGAEVNAVLKEFAKLHAGSMLLLKQTGKNSMLELFPFLAIEWLPTESKIFVQWSKFLYTLVKTAAEILETIPTYENTVKWLHEQKHHAIKIQSVNPSKDDPCDMMALCHGDAWGNNVMVRTKDDQTEAATLDFQMCRYASISTDLQKILSCSFLPGNKSGPEMNLEKYWNYFRDVCTSCNMDVPFTLQALKDDYNSKKIFGIGSCLSVLSLEAATAGKALDLDSMTDDNFDDVMTATSTCIKNTFETDKIFREKYLNLFKQNA